MHISIQIEIVNWNILMTEIYKTIRPGHLFQTNRTGAGPDYSFDYSNNYNSLPFIEMSKLRLNL